jgi:hypothetical protein
MGSWFHVKPLAGWSIVVNLPSERFTQKTRFASFVTLLDQ